MRTLRCVAQDLKTLQLRIELRKPERPNHPVVTILIDGEDVLGDMSGGFIGFDPADILDSGALIPTDPPRRVAVYRCSCGEAGCGCVAAVIEEDGDRVRWLDLRDFTGVYNVPLGDSAPTGGSPHPVTNLQFDRAQYRGEVERAAGDRSWETDERRTARLLLGSLVNNDERFVEQGYWRGWVAPHWNEPGRYHVEFIGPRGQVVVVLEPVTGTPEDQADQMARFMLDTPPDKWKLEMQQDWPAEQVRDAIAARQAKRRRGA